MQDAIQQTKTTLNPNTFEITGIAGECLITSPQTFSRRGTNNQALPGALQLFELCAAAVLSKFLYKWKKSPSLYLYPPPPIYISFPRKNNFLNIFLSQVLPQVKILDYVTIQNQGPYLQQLHIRSSLFMYTGALRLFWVRMTGRLCNGLQSHDVSCVQTQYEGHKMKRVQR